MKPERLFLYFFVVPLCFAVILSSLGVLIFLATR